MRLAALPAEERPRERLRLRGPSSLSAPELIAILLGTGSRGKDVLELSSELLAEFGDVKGLARATGEELTSFPGLGEAKACVLLAALELAKRSTWLAALGRHASDRLPALVRDDRFRLISRLSYSLSAASSSLLSWRS